MASIVATGEEARERIIAAGYTPGKQDSRVTYNSGGKTSKTVVFDDGEVVREEVYDYEAGKKYVTETRPEYLKAAGQIPYTQQEYDSARDKVLSDLQQSQLRAQEAEKVRQANFEENLNRTVATGTANPTTALVVARAQEASLNRRGVYNPVSTEINADLVYNKATGEKTSYDYFEQDVERKTYLTKKNPDLFPTEKDKEIFIRTDSTDQGNFFKNYKLRRENVKVKKEIFNREEFKQSRKQEFGLLKENVFEQLRQFGTVSKELAKPDPVNIEARSNLISNVYSARTLRPDNTTLSKPVDFRTTRQRFEDITVEKNLMLAAGGAGMVAYTAASIPANAASPMLAQTVDVGLAAPTYKRSFINPTPRNVAARNLEIIDVAIDFIPEAAGIFVGAAKGASGGLKGALAGAGIGFGIGRRVPTPNVNINANINEQLNASASQNVSFSGSEVGYGSGYAEVNLNENIQNSLYGGVTRLGNAAASFAAELPAVNVNLNRSEVNVGLTAFANENINENTNNNVLINENINENITENINENINVNENANANINENINVNANINENFNLNFNLNLPTFKNNQPLIKSSGTFQAFTKIQGIITKIGKPTASKEAAFKIGENVVEATAARTLGVTKASGQIKGIDLGLKGRYSSKKSAYGTIYIEPSKRAINTQGEFAQITMKSGRKQPKKKKITRFKL